MEVGGVCVWRECVEVGMKRGKEKKDVNPYFSLETDSRTDFLTGVVNRGRLGYLPYLLTALAGFFSSATLFDRKKGGMRGYPR